MLSGSGQGWGQQVWPQWSKCLLYAEGARAPGGRPATHSRTAGFRGAQPLELTCQRTHTGMSQAQPLSSSNCASLSPSTAVSQWKIKLAYLRTAGYTGGGHLTRGVCKILPQLETQQKQNGTLWRSSMVTDLISEKQNSNRLFLKPLKMKVG